MRWMLDTETCIAIIRQTVPGGSIRMRVAPTAVEPLIQIAARGGEVTLRSTHAEDLAEPVADTERALAMLTSQREQLESFTKTKRLPVDQLITVTKELASLQTQIDAAL